MKSRQKLKFFRSLDFTTTQKMKSANNYLELGHRKFSVFHAKNPSFLQHARLFVQLSGRYYFPVRTNFLKLQRVVLGQAVEAFKAKLRKVSSTNHSTRRVKAPAIFPPRNPSGIKHVETKEFSLNSAQIEMRLQTLKIALRT